MDGAAVNLLSAHNDGPVDSLAGWSGTEVLPEGSTLVGVVVQIPDDLTGAFKNVAYVSSAENETPETNPLVVPTIETDTVASTTDNDAQAVIDVLPPEPQGIVITLPNTGTTIPLTWLLAAIGIVAAGVILLGASRFNARGRRS